METVGGVMMIIFMELSESLIKKYEGCVSLDNGAVANYLKYGNLIVELDKGIDKEYDKLIFSIDYDAKPYNRNIEELYRSSLNYNYVLVCNTETNSLCVLGRKEDEVLSDFLYEHGTNIELGDFDPIEDDDWY